MVFGKPFSIGKPRSLSVMQRNKAPCLSVEPRDDDRAAHAPPHPDEGLARARVHAIRDELEPSETRQNTAKCEKLLLVVFVVCNSGPIAASAGSTAAQSINLYGVYSKRRVGR